MEHPSESVWKIPSMSFNSLVERLITRERLDLLVPSMVCHF